MRKEVNGTSDIWGKLNNSLKDYGEKMDALATKNPNFRYYLRATGQRLNDC